MDKKRIIIVATALIAVIAIVAGAAAALLHNDQDPYALRVEEGHRYLEAGDYNQAVLVFQQAIEIDDTREDAYMGLYTAYVKLGDYDKAIQVIQGAAGKTDSQRIWTLLNQLQGYGADNQSSVQQPGENAADKEESEDKSSVAVLNVDLLNQFCSASYGDYAQSYGSPESKMKNGICYIRVKDLPATLAFKNTSADRVIDQNKGVPYSQYQPYEIKLDNAMVLFGVKSISFNTLKNLNHVTNATMADGTISFTYQNCEITITCSSEGLITSASDNTIRITARKQTDQKPTLAVTIVDGTTGRPLMDVTVKAYAGYNTYGNAVEGKTNGSGVVSLELEKSGNYTLEFSKTGYITETAEMYVYQSNGPVAANFSIVPVMNSDEIRFVLTWSASPTDLDSHLIGTAADGTNTHISFMDMKETNRVGQTVAELDVDDTNGYGPETITLHDTGGSYEFVVVDFTNSGTMSYSSAQVKIYVGSSLQHTVSVPAGLENEWHVCDIEDGQITIVNRPAN